MIRIWWLTNASRQPDYHKAWTCDRKKSFSHHVDAVSAAIRMQNKHHMRFDVYECQFCGGFHVGGYRRIQSKQKIID